MPDPRSSLLDARSAPTLGILGSGQLAKMLAQAAFQLGVPVKVLEKHRTATPLLPWRVDVGNWDDPEVLIEFARDVDVLTLENEFINPEALSELEQDGHQLWPSAETLRLIQDKLHQKQCLQAAGLSVPPFREVHTPEEIIGAAADLGWPLVLKKRRLGYDGKGNATMHGPGDIAAAWQRLDGDMNPLMVEQFCDFEKELAIIVTREAVPSSKFHVPSSPTTDHQPPTPVVYPVVETIQRDHICHLVKAPASVSASTAVSAAQAARQAVEAVRGVGSFGVELFLLRDGRVVINEMAPRVHNSGHYTIEACACSQFENHVRAVLGWPLGSPAMRAPVAVMVNLLAAADGPGRPTGIEEALRIPGAHVHLYGKDRSVKGRKMGHVTALGATLGEALAVGQQAAALIRFG